MTLPIGITVSPACFNTAATCAACPAATTATMPMPQLKVLSISLSATPPVLASQEKTGGTSIASMSISAA
jgi:hypothetical protein